MSRTALFTIDIQHSLAHAPTAVPHAPRLLEASTALLARARHAIDKARTTNTPPPLDIVIVQHEEAASQGDLVRGSRAWDLVFPPRERDANEMLIAKSVRDAFVSNPRLADDLRARDVGTVVAFGIQSECCVLSTCRGALEEGFRVVLLRGAHGTYDGDGKTAAEIGRGVEEELQKAGAEVVDWEVWAP